MNRWILDMEHVVNRLEGFYNRKIDSNKKLEVFVTIIVLLGIVVEIYLLNKPTPWVVDDLVKSNGIGDLNQFRGWWNHARGFYLGWGGRVWGELFTLYFLTLPKHIFNYLNTFGYLLFILLIYINIIGKWKWSPSILIFINFSLFMCLPAFGQDILWISGAGNYMWASLIPLLFLSFWRFYLNESYRMFNHAAFIIALFLLGIMAGWSNENVSVGILGILVIYMYLYKIQYLKIPTFAVSGFIGTGIGAVLLWLAPGNFARFAAEHHTKSIISILKASIHNIKALLDPNATLLLVVIFILFIFLGRSKNKRVAMIYFVGAVLSAGAMGIVGNLSTRVFLGCTVLLIIAAGILYNDWHYSFRIRQTKALITICLLLASVSIYHTAKDGINDYAMRWNENLKIIEMEKAKGNLDVYVNPITPLNKFCATYQLDDIKPHAQNQHWLNKGVAKHYGLHTIQSFHIYPNKDK